MAVGGEQFICGQYTVTWNGVNLGIFEGDDKVPAIRNVTRARPVNNTDKYGYAKIDSVHMGMDYFFEGTLMEWPKAIGVYIPFGVFGVQGQIGMLKYSIAQALVLTVVANGTTAVGNPNVLTALKALISDDVEAKQFFGPNLRVIPIRMDLYPSVIVNGQISNLSMA